MQKKYFYSCVPGARPSLSILRTLLLGISLLLPLAAQAKSDISLRSLGEWISLCHSNHREAQSCLLALTRPESRAGNGDASSSYLVPLNVAKSLLLTRSGVFLSPAVQKNISHVLMDTSRRTEIVTRNGMTCALYSTIETNFIHGSAQEVLDSFARIETDDPDAAAVQLMNAGRKNTSLRFTVTGSQFIGTYIIDQHRNSGIWATCRDPDADMLTLQRSAEHFFSLISGSARHY